MKFTGSTISDQKRLVRAEQLLLARSCLRARDEVHHAKWKVLTTAGGSPSGEINALRELMPHAHVTAVDRDQACLTLALEAGVDDVLLTDVTNWKVESYKKGGRNPQTRRYDPELLGTRLHPPDIIREAGPFDLINMDLCGGVNKTMRDIVNQYRRVLTPKGVFIVTFSYGRDVIEMFVAALENTRNHPYLTEKFKKVPEILKGRLFYLFSFTELHHMASIMVYRGNEMPMCSCLYTQRNPFASDKFSYVQVRPGDFELAVVHPDVTKLYDCPADRVASLRRLLSARKAVTTRRLNAPRIANLFDVST